MESPRFSAFAAGVSLSLVFASFTASVQAAGSIDTTAPKKPPAAKPRTSNGTSRAQTAPPLRLPRPIVAPDTAPRLHAPVLPPSEFLPVSQLKAGMKGYGLSVFQGNKIERFDVTILGVMRKVNNGRDLILVKLGGPQMQRVTDVIAGMSGSPVYVNGKIVGAVSYGAQFTRESIGYLTPIEDMLDAWDPALPQSPNTPNSLPAAPAAKASLLPIPLHLDGQTFTRVAFAPRTPLSSGTLVLRPLAAKVTVSGVSSSRWEGVKSILQKMGLDARQGPGGVGGTPNKSGLTGSALVPGGAIAMSLATGDIDITAIGTLTYRRKNQVVAFGHPFLNIGPLDAPMSTAYIHDIEPSFSESTKIGSPVSLVGSFSQDRPFSVAGRIGSKPILVPVTVRVQDKAFGRDRVFHAQLVRHPQLTPQLIPLAASTAISEVHGQPGDAMATVTTTVTADEVGTITRTNRVYDGSAIDSAAITDLMSLMSLLSANPFYPVAVRNVTLSVAIEPGRKTAQVERIFLNQSRYEPGETVEVGVVLKPYKQPRVTKIMHVTIPPSTPSGVLTLSVGGGGTSASASAGMLGILLGGRGAGPDYAAAANIKQLVQKYKERDRNDALVARLQLPTAAISISGEKMPGLPANIESVLRGSGGSTGGGFSSTSLPRSSGVRLERDEVKIAEPTEFVLSGSQALPIRVARKNVPAPPTFGSPFGSGTSGSSPFPPPPSGTNSGPSSPSGSGSGTTVTILPSDPGDDEPLASGLPPATFRAAFQPPAPSNGGGGDDNSIYKMLSDLKISGNSNADTVPPTVRPESGTNAAETAKPVNRQPGVWRQTSATDFRTALKLDGVTITNAGDIRLAPRLLKAADTSEPYFWCLASDGAGGVFAGSGDNGVIYHVQNGKADVFSTTGELEVFSLVRMKNGTLFAGTAPNGRVFRIGADGKATKFWEPGANEGKYALALALSPDEITLYIGEGGPSARVVSVPVGSGSPVSGQTLYQSDETNITALAISPSGELYAGTAPSGFVVHVAGMGLTRPIVVYDASETTISGLVADPKSGDVFAAATAPRSVLYRITPGANVRVLYDKLPSGAALSGLQMAGNTLYAGSGSTIYAISTNGDTIQTFEAPSDIQILSLLAGENGRVWASTGSTGGVYSLGTAEGGSANKGEYVSSILDAKATAHWGTLRWTATVPTGASVVVQTRSGDAFDPDASWSGWSAPLTHGSGESITSPPARYLQYRAQLTSGGGDAGGSGPQIKTVEAFYLPPNQAPQVSLTLPRGGEVWKGQTTLRWAGVDPDKDTLLFEAALSGDGGKTWTPLKPAPGKLASLTLRASAPTAPKPQSGVVVSAAPPANPAGSSSLAAELARHPEISPELQTRILADAPPSAAGGDTSAAAPAGMPTRSDAASNAQAAANNGGAFVTTRGTTLPLDTTRFPDGTYLVRVRATDKPSNPDGALSDEKISGEFRIVNHAPLLVLFKTATTVQSDKTVRMEGVASHPLSGIRAVQFRVDSGEWMAARANDGIFDGMTEPFTLTTAPLSPGTHTIEVQAQDEAGNTATQKTTMVVR